MADPSPSRRAPEIERSRTIGPKSEAEQLARNPCARSRVPRAVQEKPEAIRWKPLEGSRKLCESVNLWPYTGSRAPEAVRRQACAVCTLLAVSVRSVSTAVPRQLPERHGKTPSPAIPHPPPTPHGGASELVNDGARFCRRRRRSHSRNHTRRLRRGSAASGPRLRRGRRRGPSVPPELPASGRRMGTGGRGHGAAERAHGRAWGPGTAREKQAGGPGALRRLATQPA